MTNKQNKKKQIHIETRPRAIAYQTYVMFMNKYNLPYSDQTTMPEMQKQIYDYELLHVEQINIGLYVNGLY